MKLKDYKDGMIVEVKGKDYGTYKTHSLVAPNGKGAQMVRVLHSATIGEINWDFAIIHTVRLVDIKPKEVKKAMKPSSPSYEEIDDILGLGYYKYND